MSEQDTPDYEITLGKWETVLPDQKPTPEPSVTTDPQQLASDVRFYIAHMQARPLNGWEKGVERMFHAFLDTLETSTLERQQHQQEIAGLKEEAEEAEAASSRMWAKLQAANVACACELDRSGDVCMVHVPKVQELQQALDALRAERDRLKAVEADYLSLREKVGQVAGLEYPDLFDDDEVVGTLQTLVSAALTPAQEPTP